MKNLILVLALALAGNPAGAAGEAAPHDSNGVRASLAVDSSGVTKRLVADANGSLKMRDGKQADLDFAYAFSSSGSTSTLSGSGAGWGFKVKVLGGNADFFVNEGSTVSLQGLGGSDELAGSFHGMASNPTLRSANLTAGATVQMFMELAQ